MLQLGGSTPLPDPDGTPFGVLVCRDLMFGSRISGTAAELGCRLVARSNLDQIVEAAERDDCALVLLDLSNPSPTAVELGEALPADRPSRRIAFGPHVQTARLQAARDAGFEVLTHGQLTAELPQFLSAWLS